MVETRESYDLFMKRMMEEQSREEILRKVKKSIWVTFQKEGIHCYPDAPEEVDGKGNPVLRPGRTVVSRDGQEPEIIY